MAHATLRFKDVDVLKVGNWSGTGDPWDVTEQDLHDIVAASQDALVHREIPVKVGQGHRDVNLSRDMDGDAPAYGWVRDLHVDKDDDGVPTLYATVEDVPYDLGVSIRDHYQGRSVECALGVTSQSGTKYGAVLEALAFLGQEPPAVAGLKPLPQFSRMSRGETVEGRVHVVLDADQQDNGEDTTVDADQIKAALAALPEDERASLLASLNPDEDTTNDDDTDGQADTTATDAAGAVAPEQPGTPPAPAATATPDADAAGGANLSRAREDAEGEVRLSRADHTALLSRLQTLEDERHAERRRALLSQAVEAHKITTDPDTTKFWTERYDKDPEGTTAVLEHLGVVVPKGQQGADLAHEAAPEDSKAALKAAAIAYQTGQPATSN